MKIHNFACKNSFIAYTYFNSHPKPLKMSGLDKKFKKKWFNF